MIQFMPLLMMMMMITGSMYLINFSLSKKAKNDREKTSPFECGFDPLSNNRIPFSIQFFIISLIFLIFDIEITMLIPLPFLLKTFSPPMILTSLMFLLMLISGLYIEYLETSMDWKI